jgi:hypothetical protein
MGSTEDSGIADPCDQQDAPLATNGPPLRVVDALRSTQESYLPLATSAHTVLHRTTSAAGTLHGRAPRRHEMPSSPFRFPTPSTSRTLGLESTRSLPPAKPGDFSTWRWVRNVCHKNAGRNRIERTRKRVTDENIRLGCQRIALEPNRINFRDRDRFRMLLRF